MPQDDNFVFKQLMDSPASKGCSFDQAVRATILSCLNPSAVSPSEIFICHCLMTGLAMLLLLGLKTSVDVIQLVELRNLRCSFSKSRLIYFYSVSCLRLLKFSSSFLNAHQNNSSVLMQNILQDYFLSPIFMHFLLLLFIAL